MVIDAVTQELFGKPFDRDGKIAASGGVIEPVTARSCEAPFFRAKPPKTAGREEFGREFVARVLCACAVRARKEDVVATATALTARVDCRLRVRTIRDVAQSSRQTSMFSGNDSLRWRGKECHAWSPCLRNRLAPLGIVCDSPTSSGLPSEAKEAVAFAVLAYETWHRRPSNVPSATGAKRAAVLGKISYA